MPSGDTVEDTGDAPGGATLAHDSGDAPDGVALAEDEFFSDTDDEEAAIEAATQAAPALLALLREQCGELRSWTYPAGTIAITTAADHDEGLGLDPSDDATDCFTVHREYGGGAFDVTMFTEQPRATAIGFPHDPNRADEHVGMRARALLLADIDWCERDSDDGSDTTQDGYSGSDADTDSEPAARMRIRRLPSKPLPPPEQAAAAVTLALEGDGARTEDARAAAAAAEEEEEEEQQQQQQQQQHHHHHHHHHHARDEPVFADPSSAASANRKATATGNSPETSATPRQRWASAPELDELAGELLGTREQVLACLVLQGAYRQRLGRSSHERESERRTRVDET